MGSFDTYSAILTFSLAKEVLNNLYFGVNYEMIREKQYLNQYSGRSYDFGILYKLNTFDLYSSFENSGSLDKGISGTQVFLPETTSLGIRKKINQINIGLEVQKVRSDYSEHIFTDFILNKYLSLSGGYALDDKTLSWSTGLMFKYNSLYLLFSYAAHEKLQEYKLLQFSVEL